MLKKYSVLAGVTVSVALLIIATFVYPGGSQSDKNAIGFDWTKNYISDLFDAKAANGSDNPSRGWADAAMVFLSVSIALFFLNFSKKIPEKRSAGIIKYVGAGSMLFILLTVTALHGLMVIIASTLFLINLFYITIYVLRSKLHLFKFFCILCLLIFYCTLFLYGSADRTWLPLMQKITFTSSLLLVLGLEHFTAKEDFEQVEDFTDTASS
ncbi:MAG: hypothetical protein V4658_15195 [Bacteroidota bacterium]